MSHKTLYYVSLKNEVDQDHYSLLSLLNCFDTNYQLAICLHFEEDHEWLKNVAW